MGFQMFAYLVFGHKLQFVCKVRFVVCGFAVDQVEGTETRTMLQEWLFWVFGCVGEFRHTHIFGFLSQD